MSKKRVSVIESNILQKIRRVAASNGESTCGQINVTNDFDDKYWEDWELNSNSDDDLDYDSDEGEMLAGFSDQAEGEEQETDEVFALSLAAWCISSGTSRDHMDALLHLLRPRSQLPTSTKTLLHTPSTKISPKFHQN